MRMEVKSTSSACNRRERHSSSTSPLVDRPCEQVRVIIVDPEEGFRNGLACNLRDDGHEVIECAAAREAPATDDRFAALVTVMDDRSVAGSVALARRFRRTHPDAVIVVVASEWLRMDVAKKVGTVVSRIVDYEALHNLIHRGAT
jgi:DNA-binding NtrC family response regulator